jgi:hypothetical protein
MRGSLKGNENENRCPKTGYVDAGAPEKAGITSGVRQNDADCCNDEFRGDLRTVSKWMKASREGGLRGLQSSKRGRRYGGCSCMLGRWRTSKY